MSMTSGAPFIITSWWDLSPAQVVTARLHLLVLLKGISNTWWKVMGSVVKHADDEDASGARASSRSPQNPARATLDTQRHPDSPPGPTRTRLTFL